MDIIKNMEIIKNYNEFIDRCVYSVKESLIVSMPIDDAIHAIDMYSTDDDLEFEIKNKFSFKLKINIKAECNTNYFRTILNRMLITGFFTSYYIILTSNEKLKFKGAYIESNFNDIVNKYSEIIKTVIFTCESEYETSLYKNNIDIPDNIYHIAPHRIKDDILEGGLLPNRKNRISSHPHRLYFFIEYNKNIIINMIHDFKLIDYKHYNKDIINKKPPIDFINQVKDINSDFYKYDLYEINTKEYKDKLVLHTDPNSISGYFSIQSIPKEYINKIETL